MTDAPPHPLTAYRESHGLTMTELAKQCDCKQQSIDRIEKHWVIPRPHQMNKIIRVTGLQPNDFYRPDVIVVPKRPTAIEAN